MSTKATEQKQSENSVKLRQITEEAVKYKRKCDYLESQLSVRNNIQNCNH